MIVDKVGIPLNNNDPIKTLWYNTPHFDTIYFNCLTESFNNDNLIKIEPHIAKSCFNCDGIDHELSKCHLPKDFTKINNKRNEFMSINSHTNINPNDLKYRYHDDQSKNNLYQVKKKV